MPDLRNITNSEMPLIVNYQRHEIAAPIFDWLAKTKEKGEDELLEGLQFTPVESPGGISENGDGKLVSILHHFFYNFAGLF